MTPERLEFLKRNRVDMPVAEVQELIAEIERLRAGLESMKILNRANEFGRAFLYAEPPSLKSWNARIDAILNTGGEG